MPPHSSHLLQPLDVDCFSVLKRSYGKHIETLMSLGVNQINKQDFLTTYQQACVKALHQNNIQSSFIATGLVPYDPDRVLSLIHAQYHTPSPQLRPQTQSAWMAETPHGIIQLENQTKLIKQYLRHHTQRPPSPTEQALDQLVKGCQIAMHNAVLLTNQNKKLFTENQHQKQKQAHRRSYIAREGVLTGSEAQNLIEIDESSHTAAVEEAASRVYYSSKLHQSVAYAHH